MEVWHLTFSTDGRFPLFTDEEMRRRAIRKLGFIAGGELLLYCIVDDHLHLVLLCAAGRKGRICSALLRSFRLMGAEKALPAHQRPVENRSHLNWLLRYTVQQVSHHGVDAHPATWSGSCFQDLVGARVLTGFRPRIKQLLPRLNTLAVMEMVGLPSRPIVPAGEDVLRLAGVEGLVEAAGNALAVGPELRGKTAPVVAAKRAVAQAAALASLPSSDVARALGMPQRGVGFLRLGPAEAAIQKAMRIRISLHRAIHREHRRASRPASQAQFL